MINFLKKLKFYTKDYRDVLCEGEVRMGKHQLKQAMFLMTVLSRDLRALPCSEKKNIEREEESQNVKTWNTLTFQHHPNAAQLLTVQ